MKTVLLLAFFAIAVSALPADESVPEFVSEGVSEALLQEAAAMVDQKGSNACKDLADATEKEVKANVEKEQNLLNKINTGSDCPNEGQDEVAAAKKQQSSAEDDLEAAKKAVKAAENTKINFGDFTFSALNPNACSNTFFGSSVYTSAKAKVDAAKQAKSQADGQVTQAKAGVAAAISAAAKAVKKCQCKAYKAHETALSSANTKVSDANKAAWTKAAHLKCVLAGQGTNNCNVPTMPTVNAVQLANGVTKSKCVDPWINTVNNVKYTAQCNKCTMKGNTENKISFLKSTGGGAWYKGCYGEGTIESFNDLPANIEAKWHRNGAGGNDAYAAFGMNNVENDTTNPHYDCNTDFSISCNSNGNMRPIGVGCRSPPNYSATCAQNCKCGQNNRGRIHVAKDGTVSYYMTVGIGGTEKFCCKDNHKMTQFPYVMDAWLYGSVGNYQDFELKKNV